MYDQSLLRDKLDQILTALLRIERRFAGISTPEDFEIGDANMPPSPHRRRLRSCPSARLTMRA